MKVRGTPLSTARKSHPVVTTFRLCLPIAMAILCAASQPVFAQLIEGRTATETALNPGSLPVSASRTTASLDLPDAPGALLFSSSVGERDTEPDGNVQSSQPATSNQSAPGGRRWFTSAANSDAERASHPASTTDKYILPGQLAPKLTPGNEIELGLIHSVSVYAIAGWFVSAGYSHVINGSPNYGTDSGAFGERLGASALRGVTTELFKDSVTAPLLHQDPRYYKMGPRRNIAVRAGYAVSRVLVTRNDDGRTAPNYALVSGHLLGAALTNAYYPEENRGFGQTARTFGSSMYGAAFSFFAREFLIGTLINVHLKQNQD